MATPDFVDVALMYESLLPGLGGSEWRRKMAKQERDWIAQREQRSQEAERLRQSESSEQSDAQHLLTSFYTDASIKTRRVPLPLLLKLFEICPLAPTAPTPVDAGYVASNDSGWTSKSPTDQSAVTAVEPHLVAADVEIQRAERTVAPCPAAANCDDKTDSRWTSVSPTGQSGVSAAQSRPVVASTRTQHTGPSSVPTAPKAMLRPQAPSYYPSFQPAQQQHFGGFDARHQAQARQQLTTEEMERLAEEYRRQTGHDTQQFAAFDKASQAQSSFEERKELERQQRALRGRQPRRRFWVRPAVDGLGLGASKG